jgi:aspartyl-tRNA(Asn)/glutamyl-tRNA(Gln) amidotransferase subunit C
MNLDKDLLERLEKLSSLSVESEKEQSMLSEIGEFLEFVENLGELDLENLDATFSTLEGGTPLRADIPSGANQGVAPKLFKDSPRVEEEFFIVPKIIE